MVYSARKITLLASFLAQLAIDLWKIYTNFKLKTTMSIKLNIGMNDHLDFS